MLLEVSPGEGFDKLSILEIKYARILSPEKQAVVLQEINALSEVRQLKERYPFEYASIMRVNEEMWELTEDLDPENSEFARISQRIFELNRQRFRVKRMINTAENSVLKEQKSFGDKHCVIELDVDPYSRITELYSIVFEYDTLSFDRPCKLRPFLNFVDSAPEIFSTVKLSTLGRKVEVTPLRYGCGGRLGDTIHQMSVVNEMYLKTGRKGIVYLSPTLGDPFDRNIETTFADIRGVICEQAYIDSFHLHQGEEFDINLSQWRSNNHSYDKSWHQTFGDTFGVPWAASPWIKVVPNLQYKDTTFISCGDNRRNWALRYAEFGHRIENLVFLATSQSMYEMFVYRNGVEMPYLVCPTFSDLAGVLMACKGLIGNLSMPLALADAMWKPRLAILYSYDYDCKVAMLTDKRHIIHTEELDAFKWKTPRRSSIYTFGDSHCAHGWQLVDEVTTNHLGPTLCHSFGKDPLSRCNLRNYPLRDGDTVVFSFGEIDCRCHVYKYVTETVSYKQVIDLLVDNYFKAIRLIVANAGVSIYRVCVYNVLPPVRKENTPENEEYPYLGTDTDRKTYALYFNKKLGDLCLRYGYVFVDVYDCFTDADGFLLKELSDGNVHIKDKNHLTDFIRDHLQ